MRILLVNYEYPPLGGGGANNTLEIARRLAGRGHQVAVLTTRFRGLPAEDSDQGVRVVRLRVPRRQIYQCTPMEMVGFMAIGSVLGPWRVASFRPQVALAFFSMPSGPPAWTIARRFRIPYALCVLGGDVPRPFRDELTRLHTMAKPVLRLLWREAAAIVANSEGLAALARAFEPRCPVEVIPNGVDAQRFRPASADPGRPQAPAGQREVALLTASRLSIEKGLDRLLRCLAALPASLPPWRLRIAGDGPLRGDLEAEARRLGLAGRVEFPGWQDKAAMPDLYRQADIFVLVSSGEGSPNVVLEAQASGLAVLATRVRGTEELIRPEETGLLVELGDEEALRAALARLIGDPALRGRLGAAGRRSAEACSWDAVAQSYEALCLRLAQDRSLAPRGFQFLLHLIR